MQVNRLFEIIYLLLERKSMTAAELAERFEVSTRTIYRDLDTLSGAGIPVYANKGRGGGIRLLPDFVLNKSLLSGEEQKEILFALQGLAATQASEQNQILGKMKGLFSRSEPDWIDVDFSTWGGGPGEKEIFQILKQAVIQCRRVRFQYYGSYGEPTKRVAEPYKLCFKHGNWYVQAYCLEKKAFRIFKICRMAEVVLLAEEFNPQEREIPELETTTGSNFEFVDLELLFNTKVAYRVLDEFPADRIQSLQDGGFYVRISFPEDDWLYGYLMSFRSNVTVVSPTAVAKRLCQEAKNILALYQ